MSAFQGTDTEIASSEWIRPLPDGWRYSRLKWTVSSAKNGIWGAEPDGGDDDIDCVRVADFDRDGLLVAPEIPTRRNVPENHRNGRVLRCGDLLLEKSGGGEKQLVGAVVMYQHPGPAVCSNFVARLQVAVGQHSRFLTYLHASLYFQRVNARSVKQTTGIQNLDGGQYLDEVVALPPLPTQRALADFLDRKTAAIDALIEKKQRLVALLAEKRAALIHRAVTKGLDEGAPMKDSGVPWIGEIPAHWEVKRLKFIVSEVVDCHHSTPVYDQDEPYPALRTADVQCGFLDVDGARRVSKIEYHHRVSRLQPRTGDIIYSREGERWGLAALVPEDVELCLAQRVMLFRAVDEVVPGYLMWCLNSHAVYNQLAVLVVGATSPHVNIRDIRESWVTVPPKAEQRALSEVIRAAFDDASTQSRLLEQSVTKLQEYRQSLITAAVTGQLNIGEDTP